MNVEYRTIPGFEKYEISEYGVIRVKTTGKLLKKRYTKNTIVGDIRDNSGKRRVKSLQYFVALAWLPNPNNYSHTIRKDKSGLNYHYSNIAWSLSKISWVTEEGKQCYYCKEFKPKSEFIFWEYGGGNLATNCKSCNRFIEAGTIPFDLNKNPDYKKINGYNKYAINEFGDVVKISNGQSLKVHDRGNAVFVLLTNDEGKQKTWSLKDLVAKCFLPEIEGLDFVYINGENKFDISLKTVCRSMSKTQLVNYEGRVCVVCGLFLLWDNFSNDSSRISGKKCICKYCSKNRRDSPALFNNYIHRLTIDESPIEDKDGILSVKCSFCGKYFTPTWIQVQRRVWCLEGHLTGESKLYCSDECKDNCPVYNKHFYSEGTRPVYESKYKNARDFVWRKMILERDNYTCQECGDTENLVAHHIIPVIVDYTISADLDNGVTLCASCHKIKHSEIDGCGYKELSELCHD